MPLSGSLSDDDRERDVFRSEPATREGLREDAWKDCGEICSIVFTDCIRRDFKEVCRPAFEIWRSESR